MEKGNKCNENPLTMLKTNCKKIETLFKKELAKHSSLLLETAFATVDSAITTGVYSVVFDGFTHYAYTAFMSRLRLVTPVEVCLLHLVNILFTLSSCFFKLLLIICFFLHLFVVSMYVQPLTRGKCLMSARNYAVLSGVDAGITCVMTRVRGENDIKTA